MVQGEDVVNGTRNGILGNGIHAATPKAKAPTKSFDSIEDCINSFSRGEMVIVLDDPSRENEGDLIISAQDCTTEKMAFIIRHTSGYICVPISSSRADRLELAPMVADNRDPNRTAYTVTVDAITPSLTTGISAEDRAATARMLADPTSTAEDFRRPGHVCPLRARDGGVRRRFGHTEASVELCRLAGKEQAAVICEMVLDGEAVEGKAERIGGGMMRRDDCLEFGKVWGLKVCTIRDLVDYVEGTEGKLDVAGENY